MPPNSHGILKLPNFIYVSVASASFSNFAAFYALSLITAALLYIPLSFPMDWITTAAIVTSTLIGGMIGALGAGPLADRIGRRLSMLAGSTLLLVGGLAFAVAPSVWIIMTGRFCSGLGVGVITSLANLLVVELAPAPKRGALSVIPYVFQFVGTMSPFLIGYLIVLALPKERLSLAWRLMAASGVAISTLDLISLSIWLPESPRWLLYQQRTLEGLAVMEKIYGPANHELLIQDYRTIVQSSNQASTAAEKVSWREMLQKQKYRRPLLVGISLQLIRKLSGNAAVTFYLTLILVEAAGLSKSTALLISLLIYIPDFVVVFGVFRLLDRLGRKLMMFCSCAGLALALIPMALTLSLTAADSSSTAEHKLFVLNYLQGATLEESSQIPGFVTGIVIGSLFLQRCFYSFGLGPIPSIHTAESLPHQIRATGLGLALFCSWFAAALATLFFPWCVIALPRGSAYWIFVGVAVVGLPIIWGGVRETANEHIDAHPIHTPKPRAASVDIGNLEEGGTGKLEEIPL